MLWMLEEAGAVRYSSNGSGTMPMWASGCVSSKLRKNSQSSKPARMVSS